ERAETVEGAPGVAGDGLDEFLGRSPGDLFPASMLHLQQQVVLHWRDSPPRLGALRRGPLDVESATEGLNLDSQCPHDPPTADLPDQRRQEFFFLCIVETAHLGAARPLVIRPVSSPAHLLSSSATEALRRSGTPPA